MGNLIGLCVHNMIHCVFMVKTILKTLAVCCFISACGTSEVSPFPDIIPYPQHVEMRAGSFDVSSAKLVYDEDLDSLTIAYLEGFDDHLAEVTSRTTCRRRIVFSLDPSLAISGNPLGKQESYTIEVSPRNILVKAAGHNGFVYAVQTLKQMMPVEVYGTEHCSGIDWNVPCCSISDAPRFGYRGMLLDVARYFSTVDEVKKFIDLMEMHKMNVFHWHLTDDQGWRIEIKKYPRLTQIGSERQQTLVGHHHTSKEYDGKPYGEGMWYTQGQIREIVSYASSKGITVIPEIDLPGHMMGALAAYPELGCTGGPYDVMCKWGISEDVLCAGRDENYRFLENVLEEVCELFPSEYIHIGGDECPKTRWEKCPRCQAKIKELGLEGDERHSAEHFLQSHVMKQMAEFLASKGKRIIGWEEMLQGELAPGATVMAWRRNKYGHQAARLGHDAIMTTRTNLYFDRYQSEDKDNEPLAHSSYLPVEMVWSYDPYLSEDKNAEPLTQEQKEHIIGIQANVWREYIPTDSHLEYMVCPRISALAEVQWLMPEGKDWERFRRGMDRMRKVYEVLGCSYATHFWQSEQELE